MQAGRRRGVWLLVLAFALAAPVVRAEEAPTSVVDWLRERGDDASFPARTRLFATHFPGESYHGWAEQNMRLLEALRSKGTAPRPPEPFRPASGAGRGASASAPSPAARRAVTGHGWRVTLDRGVQVLRLDMPERETRAAKPGRREEPVLASPPRSGTRPPFVSAALLGVKAKVFEDGLYAAVEVASRRGLGAMPGKSHLLEGLRHLLVEAGASDRGAAVVCAARDYGNGRHADPLPDGLREAVAREKARFEASPLLSKPIGFYTWSDELFRIFRQDRMLQTALTSEEDIASVRRALWTNAGRESGYRKMLRLAAGLTNPLVRPDVLAPAADEGPSGDLPYHVLPPSLAHETELAKRLWSDHVPEGANLFDELIPRVRDGRLSLEPREDSGWYDHVTWSLEPLLRPDAQPEADRLTFTTGYREYLEEMFKGLLALTRETHIKQLEIPFCGACMPPPQIPVGPGLTVEPLATHYRRRADAYRFVRGVLEEAFGEGGLSGMSRLTIDGPVGIDLDTELELMTRLFDGAAQTALHQIGSSHADASPEGAAARAVFSTWRALAANDPDLQRDTRMMVPVFYDLERRKTKVWVFLGWQSTPLTISYEKKPAALGWERLEGGGERQPELRFDGQAEVVAYPVVAEVYVTELLDRKELRARCDRLKTRSAILRSLR